MVFTRGKKHYKEISERIRMYIFIPRYGIYVEDEELKYDYETLLDHRCAFCAGEPPFKDFKDLRQHVQKTHELYSCDLCTEYIKVNAWRSRIISGSVIMNRF